ncbi:hypothetical protein [Dictyobacter kobayashii]|uniref:Uncharacterized protein n=1 Tax=Dictyobacter kobayashii TaxID=2014872 RepID=A0A402AQJ4_9CHLR|nr:hypothetical protein [Dictyobacter kobayashii]GCE21397.1 hypothetical protein KDK_51970 [Dictyobacter kobayashii]
MSVATAPTANGQANIDKEIDTTLAVVKAGGTNYKEDPSAPKTVKVGGDTWQQKVATMDLTSGGTKEPVKIYVLAVQHGKAIFLMDYILSQANADSDAKQYIQPVLDSFKFV